ncbi:MAG: cytochrome B, partial [Candidatus Zixiibacteriota bacterium]
ALLFLVLIATGVSMHYASLDKPLVPFETAIAVHNVSGVTLALLYVFFFVGNLISGNGRYYRPKLRGLIGRLMVQTRYYLSGIFKGEPHPYHPSIEEKFNPLQQLTYLGIMYVVVPVLVITGIMLLFPELAPEKVFGAAGVWPAAVLHSIVAFFGTVFLVGHIYLATTGPTITADFKEMLTGWHEVESEEATETITPVPCHDESSPSANGTYDDDEI